jgi:class 3 adenylate cyclase
MGLQRRQHKRFISEITSKNEGSIFQEEGDAYWIQFPSVTTAVFAAIEMHQSLRTMQAGKGDKQRLSIRAVITVGDILYQENDTIGTTLSLTARIEKITPPDEIYLSHAAWLVMNKGEIQTSFVNEFDLKGFVQPEKVYKVDQKYRTRVLHDQYIIYTDAKGFTRFMKSEEPEQVESFLLACDDLFNDICEKHSGVIRQMNGDEYFITFADPMQTLSAIKEICQNWEDIIKQFGIGISMGIHRGNINIIRSFVYGEDIHTTVALSGFDKIYGTKPDEVWVITSNKIVEDFHGLLQEGQCQKLDGSQLTLEKLKTVFQQHGAYRLLLH